AVLLTAAVVPLLAAAAWLGLRELCVERLPAALTVGALVSLGAVIAPQLGGATLDPAALAWLLACGALSLCARRRPALLAPATLAAGLAIGTKPTAVALTVLVLAAALWTQRGRLTAVARPLAAATACAL